MLDRALRRFVRTGLRRGLLEGSTAWLALGVTAGVVALGRRAARRRPEVVWRGVLEQGQSVVVTVEEPAAAG